MTSWVDIAIIAIIAFFALIGLWKSAGKTILKLICFIGALAITYFGATYVLNWVFGMEWVTNILLTPLKGLYYNWISGITLLEDGTFPGVIGSIVNPIIATVDVASYGVTVTELAAGILAYNAVKIIVYILVYAVARCVVSIIGWIVKKVAFGGTPNALGRLVGFVFGAVRGAALVVVLLIVSTALYAIGPLKTLYADNVDNSMIGSKVAGFVNAQYDKFLYGDSEVQLMLDRLGLEKTETPGGSENPGDGEGTGGSETPDGSEEGGGSTGGADTPTTPEGGEGGGTTPETTTTGDDTTSEE